MRNRRSLVEVSGSQWKATIENGSGGAKLMYVSLSMSLRVVSQFTDFQCIGDLIRGLLVTSGTWQVASGK